MKWKIGRTALDVLPPVKRYMNAIERRLHADRKTRVRMMTELAGDFQSRREAGQRDEEIMAELGTPEEVAAQFNEALGGAGARPVSRWRWAFAVAAGLVLLWPLAAQAIARLWWAPEASSIGIIGGADGPTAIYVAASTPDLTEFLPWLLACLAGFLLLGWCRRGPVTRCRLPIALCALGLALWLLRLAVLLGLLAGLGAPQATVLLPLWTLALQYLPTFLSSGAWLCLAVLVFAVRERRRAKHAADGPEAKN